MAKSVFQSQLEDEEAVRGLHVMDVHAQAMSEAPAFLGVETAGMAFDADAAIERLRTGATDLENPLPAEAIVMLQGYPSLLIRQGDYEEPKNPVWRSRLDPNRAQIKHIIANTGRVDLVGHRDFKWVGTCWRVSEDAFVTNRHVAEIFAAARGNGFAFMPGVTAYVDLAEEHMSQEEMELLIGSIVHIEAKGEDAIDMAVMRIDPSAAQSLSIAPIELSEQHDRAEFIGVVGYPARDFRNPEDAMSRIFGGIYNVKRLAPGRVMNPDHGRFVFTHNATTLGGNSGSVIFDVATGKAVGLHFAGSAREQNYAVKGRFIADRLRRAQVPFLAPLRPAAGAGSAAVDEAGGRREDFSDRDGYRADFLGDRDLRVALPLLGPLQQAKAAKTTAGETVLKYRHFSVVLRQDRKLAYFCAANIDGASLRRPRRPGGFRPDPRLAAAGQAGEDLYAGNDLDRGHLVRRLDPAWGSSEDAEQANRDSMYFPNIAPQHKDLNQKIWLELEDHILDLTDAEDARVSVFVGCLFGDEDPVHRKSGVKVPMGFWKIVASIGRTRSGRSRRPVLQAQAFVLFQEHLVKPSDLEILFGTGFGVHQVTVEHLERLCGLDFHVLREADTFGLSPDMREQALAEALRAEAPVTPRDMVFKPIASLEDVVI